MTIEEAKKELLLNERAIVSPEFANEIAEAFGESLDSLKLSTYKTEDFDRANYSEATAKLESVAIYQLANKLAWKLTGQEVYSNMNGRGSYADDITRKSVALL